MRSESRQFERRNFGQDAWVKLRNCGIESLVPCTIADVSAGGARLTFRFCGDVPEPFGANWQKSDNVHPERNLAIRK